MNGALNYCWMPVEPRFVARVDALLEELRASERPPASPRSGRRRNNDGGVVWSGADLAAFMAAGQKSYQRVRAFGDVLAASPGKVFTTGEASAEAGLKPKELGAALGKFTTWMRAATENVDWPFGWAYGEAVDPDNPTEFHYCMSEEQASAWVAARG